MAANTSYKEACELIARFLKERQGIEITPEEVFNASPTGELSHVHAMYHVASDYYARQKREEAAERDAFATCPEGTRAAQDAARWQLAAQIALTADARADFLADGDGHAPGDPRWMAFHDALGEEMRLRREYFDTFGTPPMRRRSNQMTTKCTRCNGCGKIADTDDGEPWTQWANLPLQSATAVLMGIVKPIPCPKCGGAGVALNADALADLYGACETMLDTLRHMRDDDPEHWRQEVVCPPLMDAWDVLKDATRKARGEA